MTVANAQTNTVTSTVTGTNTVTGTTTVDKTPPTASAPSIVINNSDVCKSAYSAGVQTQILGIASGITVTDENCERLKLARSLYGMGMKVAAVSALCQDARVFDAMVMAGTPCPYKGKIGDEALKKWKANSEDIPSGSQILDSKKKEGVELGEDERRLSGGQQLNYVEGADYGNIKDDYKDSDAHEKKHEINPWQAIGIAVGIGSLFFGVPIVLF